MSNINGKAYAMNLITPVYVHTGWLLLFFIPGLVLLVKCLSYFLGFPFGEGLGGLWAVLLAIAGVGLLLLGLARWIGIVNWLHQYLFWLAAATCFYFTTQANHQLWSAVVIGILGLALLIVGFLMLRNGITWLNRLIFWLAGLPAFQATSFGGLLTLSLIHYARWVIVRDKDFPCFAAEGQPREELKYGYMFFFSNFNGSWTQYVDSFSVAIPGGLNLLWKWNLGWHDAKVETPFNGYVTRNQIDTEFYYNSYPLASSNDVKSAKKVKRAITDELMANLDTISPEDFKKKFDKVITERQADLSKMEPTPVVSLAHEAIERRQSIQEFEQNELSTDKSNS